MKALSFNCLPKVDIPLISQQWAFIEGFNSRYMIGSSGWVYDTSTGGYLQGSHRQGYVVVSLVRDGKWVGQPVHRLVANAFIHNPENKPDINHKNSIRNDNRVENLEWCTRDENWIHAAVNGRLVKHHYIFALYGLPPCEKRRVVVQKYVPKRTLTFYEYTAIVNRINSKFKMKERGKNLHFYYSKIVKTSV